MGETVKVVRFRPRQNCEAIRVRTESGEVEYLVECREERRMEVEDAVTV